MLLFINNKMYFLVFLYLLSLFKKSASASDQSDSKFFHKCCPTGQNLIRITDADSKELFECLDEDNTELRFNVSYSPLSIGSSIEVKYGMFRDCDEVQMQHTVSDYIAGDDDTVSVDSHCFDRLVIEVVNGSRVHNIPKIVVLKCFNKESSVKTRKTFEIDQVRKCCASGKRFDVQLHSCRQDEYDDTWLPIWMGNTSDRIYEIVNGLDCKADNYVVELSERSFNLKLDGSTLLVKDNEGKVINSVSQGEWCIENEYHSPSLVARVCSNDCSLYGAYCVRKCCPFGYHFQPVNCHSLISTCVLNRDEKALYNISTYLDPIENEYEKITDIMGIRPTLICPKGRFVLNDTLDPFHLTKSGFFEAKTLNLHESNDYCLEIFDRRFCPNGNVESHGMTCFKEAELKNFQFSRIFISISAVCLALTLVVYIGLPELQNLHGRTLISHVSAMLLAYTCLARVQFGFVANKNVCMILGYGIYFGFVASFAWLNVMCFDIWWTFGSIRTVQPLSKASSERRKFTWYSLYAWTLAVTLTLITYLLDQYPVSSYLDSNIGIAVCWFSANQNSFTDWPHYIFFVMPTGLLTCTNFVLWVLTARHCARVKSEVHRLQAGSVGERAKKRFRLDRAKYILTGRLWVVMGAGWVYELLSTVLWNQSQWLWSILDFLNEMQGVFIFLILVFKPKVYYLIRKRLGMEKPEMRNGTSSSGRTSTTYLSRAISTDERTNNRTSVSNDKQK